MEQSPPTEEAPQHRIQITGSTLVAGLVLITVGIWATLSDTSPKPLDIGLVLVAGFGLAMLARFFVMRRTETGLMFLGSTILLGAGAVLAVWLLLPEESLLTLWPLGFVILGVSILLTTVFTAGRLGGLLLVGLSFLLAGALALPYTLGLLPPAIIDILELIWPVLLALAALFILLGTRTAADKPDAPGAPGAPPKADGEPEAPEEPDANKNEDED